MSTIGISLNAVLPKLPDNHDHEHSRDELTNSITMYLSSPSESPGTSGFLERLLACDELLFQPDDTDSCHFRTPSV
jgi:hypothetical protein